jgi:hypothetical protein
LLRLTRTGIRKFQRQASDLVGTVEDHFPDCLTGRESQRDIHQGVTTELPGRRGIYALEAAGGIRHRRPLAGKVYVSAQARVEPPSTFSQRPSMRSLNSTHARSIAPRGMSWIIGFPCPNRPVTLI